MAELKVTQVRSAIGTKPKQRGTLRALGLGRIGRSNTLPDRPEIRGMIARVPHLVTVEEVDGSTETETAMKIHDLQPTRGSNRRRKRVGRGIGGKGGKTAGRGTKGQKARSRSPPASRAARCRCTCGCPSCKGFNNPFRVEYQAHQPRHPRGHRPRRGRPRAPCTPRASPTRAPW